VQNIDDSTVPLVFLLYPSSTSRLKRGKEPPELPG
jgi:hypothetical protein